jgi:hypothetical protein
VVRFRKRPAPKRKLSVSIQARLARGALRAARSAAESGKCAVAEMLFGFGGVDLHGAVTRARTKGAVFKTLDAGMEAADASKAIIDCRKRERERAAASSPGATHDL